MSGPGNAEIIKGAPEPQASAPHEDVKNLAKLPREELTRELEKRFGPSAFRAALLTEAGKKGISLENRQSVIDAAVKSYQTRYGKIMEEVLNERLKLEEAQKTIAEETESALDALKKTLEAAREKGAAAAAIKATPVPAPAERTTFGSTAPHKVPIVGPLFANDTPIVNPLLRSSEYLKYKESKDRQKEFFKTLVQKLSEQYLDKEAQQSDLGERYTALSILQAQNTIDTLYETHRATPQSVEAYAKELERNFQLHSGLDGQPGTISIRDLTVLKQAADGAIEPNLMRLITAGKPEQIVKRLEALHLENPDAWVQSAEATVDILIKDAAANGTTKELVDAVNAYRKNQSKSEKVADFDAAARSLKKIMKQEAVGGVRGTIAAIEFFNKAINAKRLTILDGVKPASLRPLVYRERELLLSRRLVPENDYDQLVVAFMSATRAARENMLSDPKRRAELFSAIRAISRNYPVAFSEMFGKNIPAKISQLKTRPGEPERPTRDDEAARLQALILLAQEAEWVVGNMNFKKELDASAAAPSKKEAYKPNLRFSDPARVVPARYVSVAAQYGFNGRDLALNTLKFMAGVSVVLNGAEIIKHPSDPTNPLFWGSIATIYGINRYKENPNIGRYLTGSPGEQERVATQVKLISLSKKTNRRELDAFTQKNSPEWEAMSALKPRQIQKLIDKAAKRASYPQEPVITKEDLAAVIPKNLALALPDSQNRLRFQFYSKFLTGDTNKQQLKESIAAAYKEKMI